MILKLNDSDIARVCATCKWYSNGFCKLNLENHVPIDSVKRCKTWDQAYGASCVRT